MNIIIEIYLIVCVLLLLFDITFLFLKNHRNREFYPKNRDLEEELRKEIRRGPFPRSLRRTLARSWARFGISSR